MIKTSKKTLISLSAIVWIVGGIILLFKGIALVNAAQSISSDIIIILIVCILAFAIGLIKNKFIMTKFCRKNIKRINSINVPQIHQFFEPTFFLFLTLMILTGIALSELASGNYGFLLAVGCLDLTLSTALLTSSSVFFSKNNIGEK